VLKENIYVSLELEKIRLKDGIKFLEESLRESKKIVENTKEEIHKSEMRLLSIEAEQFRLFLVKSHKTKEAK
jgi:hypothetical protein